jgi:hypothetical protein
MQKNVGEAGYPSLLAVTGVPGDEGHAIASFAQQESGQLTIDHERLYAAQTPEFRRRISL